MGLNYITFFYPSGVGSRLASLGFVFHMLISESRLCISIKKKNKRNKITSCIRIRTCYNTLFFSK